MHVPKNPECLKASYYRVVCETVEGFYWLYKNCLSQETFRKMKERVVEKGVKQ